MAVDSKLANFSCFQNFRFLFGKNRLFLGPKLSRNPTDSFDTATTLLPLTIYLKSSIFSLENPNFFWKKNKFCTFWGNLLLQSHSTAKLIPLAISKKNKFNPKTYLFFLKSKNILNSLRKLPYSVAFHSKIATFSHFKVNSFFWRIHVLFWNSQEFERFEKC